MKKLTIDRLEGKFAICRDADRKWFAIEISELPKGAAAGSSLTVDDERGTLSLAAEAPQKK
ncbi:MAG TPA: DUF3006 domain-containing protein [Ruminococcaceae bacterium]|jgi:hypothetical protein|nr:DUF3006 domain-containing protein [Oscillospiraceae bacterium]HBQ45508.1 DUF3006 domain-containing protein [Oscillospiraceae bacterium]HBT90935.1 DUF3006 domain-containing protein [Oscillospiraceae bacterium]HCB92130.1 DUF3006 domain-containing protein [Oscillospiraceae bacterium]